MEVTGQELVAWNKDHQAQVMKGKRTKRSRLPSPLRLSMASSSIAGRTSTDDNSGGSSSVVDMATTSTDHQLRVTSEEEDMANCLILLAQGHAHDEPSSHNNHDKASSGLYVYQCKTCDRCFPSFQALGGHRASHKKPKPNNNSEEKLQSVTFKNQEAHEPYDPTDTSFVLSLQISNRASYSSNSNSNKSKVHGCSICGADFTSGQALGGHMRRHRTLANNSATCTTRSTGNNNSELQQANKPKNVFKLDLNLPAPEDDHRESKLPFQTQDNVLVFSASSLVDCHY